MTHDLILSVSSYLSYLAVDVLLLLVGSFVYVKCTSGDELEQIRDGNSAAAVALAGTIIGFGLVLYSATTHNPSIPLVALWAGIALIVQIIAFEIVLLVLYVLHDSLKAKIHAGDMAHGILLGAFSLAVGIINAACIT